MIKNITLFFVISILSGCSYIPRIVIYNSSQAPIEVCNLYFGDKVECVTIDSKDVSKIGITATQDLGIIYSVSTAKKSNIYTVDFSSEFDYLSKVYCKRLNKSFCDIAVQYNEDETFIWSGRNEKHPAMSIPDQPLGFPINPDA